MKCPRCGAELVVDSHRKYDVMMCYDCGWMEGRDLGENITEKKITNFERLHNMSFNETVAFLANHLKVSETAVSTWLDSCVC